VTRLLIGFGMGITAMLLVLGIAAKPISDAYLRGVHVADLKAKLKMCDTLRGKRDEYNNHVGEMFTAGCMYSLRQGVTEIEGVLPHGKTKEEVAKIFDEKDGIEYEKYINFCSEASARYQREGYISDIMINDLFNSLGCAETYIEADHEQIQ